MNSLLWLTVIRLQTIINIYKAIVEPIMTYEAECWTVTEKSNRKIEAIEMEFLRRVSRVSWQEHIINEEIQAMNWKERQ